ncbi:MAG: PrsW family intramembrane metalloprotease [Planctomycetaceae bacterium]|jgi:RsiW-degrading membrane proteinase PrsW (M82 family)|nr:PrsW family intramembrane metalloprotease [Planctomycetaceae bacterium]
MSSKLPNRFFLGTPEVPKGPYSMEMLRNSILEGKLSAKVKVCREGTSTWMAINEVPEFNKAIPVQQSPTDQRWYLGNAEDKLGPYTTSVIQKGIVAGKILPSQKVFNEGMTTWVPLNEIPEFFDACVQSPGNSQTNIYQKTKKQIIEEIRQTNFKAEIIPIDESNFVSLIKDGMFWLILVLGVLPLIIGTLQDSKMQLVGMLFFFAALWGGILRGIVLKSNEKVTLPIVAFFFTGFVGIPMLLIIYSIFPKFYMNLASSDNPITSLFGFIFQVGLCEEICKILPVVGYLIWKRKNASPTMILLIGLFSGLGFAAFENIQYSNSAIIRTVMRGVHGFRTDGAEGLVTGIAHGTMGAMVNVILRSLSCVFAHALWSGIFAYYFAKAVSSHSRWFVLVFLGLAIPAILHGTYDWFCGVQEVIAALIVAISFLLFYGYLAKMRQ